MSYSRVEILELENPFASFNEGDVLADHKEIFEELSPKEKKILAEKIILGCPKEKLNNFYRAIQALRVPAPKQDAEDLFYKVLSDAYQVKSRLLNILDHRNHRPYEFLLEDLSLELLHRFKDLAQQVLSGKEAAVAEQLALHTPAEHRSTIAKRSLTVCPNGTLSEKIRIAFNLQRMVQHHLLGENPELFFDKDYNRDVCLEFSNVILPVKEKAEEIGIKFAQLSPESRNTIIRHLKLLTTAAHDKSNPFKLIMEHMMKHLTIGTGAQPGTLFSGASKASSESNAYVSEGMTPP